ncbi:MAG: protein YfjF [Moraxellaceae bacterium]|jgi:putative ubiquitin-RnfH superfamily antitoxin RatB of RatAB toxin-antitoxin module|nr:protein YfjF [Moraxellaceae bacterium]
MANADTITVEVVYGLPQEQALLQLAVPAGTTVREAARLSRLAERFPEIDIEHAPLGIFGKLLKAPETQPLREGDRVEIYRPLLIDPKEARRLRALRAKAKRAAT